MPGRSYLSSVHSPSILDSRSSEKFQHLLNDRPLAFTLADGYEYRVLARERADDLVDARAVNLDGDGRGESRLALRDHKALARRLKSEQAAQRRAFGRSRQSVVAVMFDDAPLFEVARDAR